MGIPNCSCLVAPFMMLATPHGDRALPWTSGGWGEWRADLVITRVSVCEHPQEGDDGLFCISSGTWAVKTPGESFEHVKNKGAMATLGWVCIRLLHVIVLMGRTEMALSKQCFSRSLSSQRWPWLVGLFFPVWRVLSLRWKWVNWVVLTNNSRYLWI